MTILHIMQCTNLGGMEQVAFRQMDALAEQSGLDFRITTPRPFGAGAARVHELDASARAFRYRGKFGWRDFRAFRAHVHSMARDCSHVWVTGTCAASLAAVRGLAQPVVLSHHYHHFEGPLAWPRWRAFYELLCANVDIVTYPTRFTRDEALQIAPWLAPKTRVAPNGYVPDYRDEVDRLERRAHARAMLGLGASDLVVGSAGWLIKRKRPDVFLRTAAWVRGRIPNAKFVICGGGPEEPALRKQVGDLGLTETVRFEGWIAELDPYYRAFDVLLFNSDFDTLPCAPMEAAARGCPTVASLTYGGLGEFINHGVNGYLFDRHDIEKLGGAIERIARDPEKANAIRRAARRTLEEHYSPAVALSCYRSFFCGNLS